MRQFRAELHVHTVLSPCAEIEMLPPLIIQQAQDAGINLLAITDHNATTNIQSVITAAQGTDIHILPGVELQTREDVHTLCLFDTLLQAVEFQTFIDDYLPRQANSPEHFGTQLIVDATGDFIREETQLLITSCRFSLEQAYQKVHALNGLFIPAHINRTAFGLIETLGFVPEDIHADALEISSHITPTEARKRYPQIASFPIIHSGDAHRLDEMLGLNQFVIEAPCISEIRKALDAVDGRSIHILLKDVV